MGLAWKITFGPEKREKQINHMFFFTTEVISSDLA